MDTDIACEIGSFELSCIHRDLKLFICGDAAKQKDMHPMILGRLRDPRLARVHGSIRDAIASQEKVADSAMIAFDEIDRILFMRMK